MLFKSLDRLPAAPCLLYVMDPMCSWCWAFSGVLDQLKKQLPPTLPLYTLMGGLAADSDAPMPIALRQQLQATWERIEQLTGTPFNYQFWQENSPRRSTYPACRAVIAAGHLQQDHSDAMIRAIQQAYYLEARNPSDLQVLSGLAAQLGLDPQGFTDSLRSDTTERRLQQHLEYKTRLGVEGFPALLLYREQQFRWISQGYSSVESLNGALEREGVELSEG